MLLPPLIRSSQVFAAAGSTQATATALDTDFCVVSSGTGGVRLPKEQRGNRVVIRNTTGSSVNVYPPTGGQINALGANAAYALPAGAAKAFISATDVPDTTDWTTETILATDIAFVFSGNNTWTGTNTFSNAVTFNNTTTFNNANTFAGGMTSTAANSWTNTQTISGNISSSGTNTFSGDNTFSGNISSSGSNSFSNTNIFTGTAHFRASSTIFGEGGNYYMRIIYAGASFPGYIEWYNPSNVRLGYIGYTSGGKLLITADAASWDFNGTAPTINGSSISLVGHTHAGTDITSGTIADARLSSNVALKNAAFDFTNEIGFTSHSGNGSVRFYGTNYTSHWHYGPNDDIYIRPGTASGNVIIGDTSNSTILIGAGSVYVAIQTALLANGGAAITGGIINHTFTNTGYATTDGMLRLVNTSATGQSPLDWIINGTFRGRVRTDYVGNMNYVANGGGHNFLTGGDFGTGTNVLQIVSSGMTLAGVLTQTGNTFNSTGKIQSNGWDGAYATGHGVAMGVSGGMAHLHSYNSTAGTYPALTITTSTLYLSQTAYVYAGSKRAFDLGDSWLRLNQAGDFTSGVYTPNLMRADGGLFSPSGNITSTSGIIATGGDVYAGGGFRWNTDTSYYIYNTSGAWTYASWRVGGARGGYTGVVLDVGAGWTFMTNGSNIGVYGQSSGYWTWYDDQSYFYVYRKLLEQSNNWPYTRITSGGSASGGNITISTSAASGTPADGDIWFQRAS